jgi:hypothetical protein
VRAASGLSSDLCLYSLVKRPLHRAKEPLKCLLVGERSDTEARAWTHFLSRNSCVAGAAAAR